MMITGPTSMHVQNRQPESIGKIDGITKISDGALHLSQLPGY